MGPFTSDLGIEPASATAPAPSTLLPNVIKAGQSTLPGVLGMFNRQRRRGLANQMRHLKTMSGLQDLNYGLENLNQQEADVNRQAERDPYAIKARLASSGASGGSQEKTILDDQKRNVAQRLNSINRARARLKWGFDAGEQMADLQRAQQKLEDQEARIGAILGTAMWATGAALTPAVPTPGTA